MRILRNLRAAARLSAFLALTLPLMLVQYFLITFGLPQAKTLPHRYHKLVCRLLGIRVKVIGSLDTARPALLVSNHVSWLDIPALSSAGPVCFVAKAEVSRWPFVSLLAKLQRTVFVDRTRRTLVKNKASEIADRLAQGDNIVLFAEGTSSDGNRVLPFRSSLFSAACLEPTATASKSPRRIGSNGGHHIYSPARASNHAARTSRDCLVWRYGYHEPCLERVEKRAGRRNHQHRRAGAARFAPRPQGAGRIFRSARQARLRGPAHFTPARRLFPVKKCKK